MEAGLLLPLRSSILRCCALLHQRSQISSFGSQLVAVRIGRSVGICIGFCRSGQAPQDSYAMAIASQEDISIKRVQPRTTLQQD